MRETFAITDEITAPEGSGAVLVAYDSVWASDFDNRVLFRLRLE